MLALTLRILKHKKAGLLPAFLCTKRGLFSLAGWLFWSGYTQSAEARALGFGLTFYPSVLMLLILCIRQLS